jgi:hypothetical protein
MAETEETDALLGGEGASGAEGGGGGARRRARGVPQGRAVVQEILDILADSEHITKVPGLRAGTQAGSAEWVRVEKFHGACGTHSSLACAPGSTIISGLCSREHKYSCFGAQMSLVCAIFEFVGTHVSYTRIYLEERYKNKQKAFVKGKVEAIFWLLAGYATLTGTNFIEVIFTDARINRGFLNAGLISVALILLVFVYLIFWLSLIHDVDWDRLYNAPESDVVAQRSPHRENVRTAIGLAAICFALNLVCFPIACWPVWQFWCVRVHGMARSHTSRFTRRASYVVLLAVLSRHQPNFASLECCMRAYLLVHERILASRTIPILWVLSVACLMMLHFVPSWG